MRVATGLSTHWEETDCRSDIIPSSAGTRLTDTSHARLLSLDREYPVVLVVPGAILGTQISQLLSAFQNLLLLCIKRTY
jgi:hypothetical protein